MQKNYYHLFANGADAKNFITSEDDFRSAFNRFGICAANTDATVLSFSIDETHPHGLIYATYESCLNFKRKYESSTVHYIAATRGSLDDVVFELDCKKIEDETYLKNVAVYTVIQATKDGKRIMPYDYRWGTGSMYFRPRNYLSIWEMDESGKRCIPVRYGDMSYREQRRFTSSKSHGSIPDDWLVCNGLILPSNYVDVTAYEDIFKTHNCYRVFQASSKSIEKTVIEVMSNTHGIELEDLEARRICEEVCQKQFSARNARHLSPAERLKLGGILRGDYHMSMRQAATMARLPESELRKYFK